MSGEVVNSEFDQPEFLEVDTNLRLRKYQPDDAQRSLSWYQDIEVVRGVSRPENTEPFDLVSAVKRFKALREAGEIYVIEINENSIWTAIGDVTLGPKTLPIAVKKSYWGQGIGKKVIQALFVRTIEMKWQKITLRSVDQSNKRAQRLYESCGFTKIGESEDGVFYSTTFFTSQIGF